MILINFQMFLNIFGDYLQIRLKMLIMGMAL